ncbi:MAG TPA: NVEALA domain-containing protein [Macellibacteroides fermentans]|uniref:NVEALA domain-containing protein n=1 Tax=Macellibacteroides fermentans TaxID=879969 RepID=UPI002C8EE797|nr:NVEALA domain-containing protein [Macellibacteroides fermentans]
MKKRLFCIVFVVGIVTAGLNFTQDVNDISLTDLTLANVEALATCEKTVGGSCWWNSTSFNICCEGGTYGCSPCD